MVIMKTEFEILEFVIPTPPTLSLKSPPCYGVVLCCGIYRCKPVLWYLSVLTCVVVLTRIMLLDRLGAKVRSQRSPNHILEDQGFSIVSCFNSFKGVFSRWIDHHMKKMVHNYS